MKYFRVGNDLYTGYAPEEAVEITAAEYAEIMATRTLIHVPSESRSDVYSIDDLNSMTDEELSLILSEMGISANMTKENMINLILVAQSAIV